MNATLTVGNTAGTPRELHGNTAGTPRELRGFTVLSFRFQILAQMKSQQKISSDEFEFCGRQWFLDVYPRGYPVAATFAPMFSAMLS